MSAECNTCGAALAYGDFPEMFCQVCGLHAENERLRELVAYREEQALDRYRDRNKARNRVNALDAELFALRARYDKLAGALEHIGRERCPHVYMDDKRPFAAYCNPCHARAALLEETPE